MIKKYLSILLAIIAILSSLVTPVSAQEVFEEANFVSPEQVSPQKDVFYKGIVVSDPEESFVTEFGQTLIVQETKVQLSTGPSKDKILDLNFELRDGSPGAVRLEKGDKVVVGKSFIAGEESYYISDVYRLNALWFLVAVFFLLILILAGWFGVRSIFGLLFSFVVIVFYIVPKIINGGNALWIGFLGTLVIALFSIFVAHGFRSRTVIAFFSTITTIFFSLFLAVFFTNIMHLFGLGSEEAFLLQTTPDLAFNLRGILIAGIIIGTLGVLDDITTAQSAVVEELHLANKKLSFKELFVRASSVGKEHIISLVNTLVLAYTGASLPLILLFQIYEQPTWIILNSEILAEEILRMLIGSIALVLAVPLTTALAAWYYGKKSVSQSESQNV